MSLKCPLQGLQHVLLAEGEDGYSGALTLTQHLIFFSIYSWSKKKKINTPSSAGSAERSDSSVPAISKVSNSWCIANGRCPRHGGKMSRESNPDIRGQVKSQLKESEDIFLMISQPREDLDSANSRVTVARCDMEGRPVHQGGAGAFESICIFWLSRPKPHANHQGSHKRIFFSLYLPNSWLQAGLFFFLMNMQLSHFHPCC